MTITKTIISKVTLLAGVLCLLTACELPTETKEQEYNLFEGLEAVEGADEVKVTINQGSAVGRDAYFEFEVENTNSPLLKPGVYDGWCIDWTKSIAQQGDTHENLKMYSTFGKEKWKPVNYFLNTKEEFKANDSDIGFAEFQAVIWSVQEGPEFDINKLSDEELPPRLLKDGKPIFSREKVNAIVEEIRKNAPNFEYGPNTKYALFLKTGEGEQDVMVPADPPEDDDESQETEVTTMVLDVGEDVNSENVAVEINNNGEIVGSSNSRSDNFDNNIFIWSEDGGVNLIPAHPDAADFHLDDQGNDINNNGVLVGRQWPIAVKWDEVNGIQSLVEEPKAGIESHVANGINDNGIAVGSRSDSDSIYAIYWDENNEEHTLPALPGYSGNATDINNKGQIAGINFSDNEWLAVLWNDNEITEIGDLGERGEVHAINENGQVVGYRVFDGEWTAFYGDEAMGLHSISVLNGYYSVATDINNHGQIVGYVNDMNGYEQVGFFWGPEEGLVLLEPEGGSGRSAAYGLNDHGEVVGTYSSSDTPSASKAIRWTIGFE